MVDKIHIHAGKLIDGISAFAKQGAVPPADIGLVISGGKIESMTHWDELKHSTASQILDWSAYTVLPGLVDAYVHLTWNPLAEKPWEDLIDPNLDLLYRRAFDNARAAFRTGITAMRELGGPPEVLIPLRDAFTNDLTAGPRLSVSGRPITTPGGHLHEIGMIVPDDPAAMQEAVVAQLEQKINWICIVGSGATETPGSDPYASQYCAKSLAAAVETAHSRSIPVAVQCRPTAAIEAAIEAGADSIENLSWYGSAHGAYDYRTGLVQELLAHDIFPVLPIYGDRPAILERGLPGPFPERQLRLYQHVEAFEVPLIPGSGAGLKGTSFEQFAYGLELFHRYCGPLRDQAIEAATSSAARAIHAGHETGGIQVGKSADLIAVSGDPYADLTILNSPVHVMRSGMLIDLDSIDKSDVS